MMLRAGFFLLALTVGSPSPLVAQSAQTLINNPDWVKAFPPFRMIGTVHWVGTYDLSTYLITTPAGHILINTGLPQTASQITKNVEQLGFKVADIKVLTATHGHFDHVAGLAALKRLTKAQLVMSEQDAPLLESGGKTDFRWGSDPAAAFEDGRTYRVGIINMGSVNPGVRLRGMPGYPTIADDYAKTFSAQKALNIDVFLASHAGQFRLHQKYKPGEPYRADRFVDPAGYRAAVDALETTYRKQIAEEANQPKN